MCEYDYHHTKADERDQYHGAVGTAIAAGEDYRSTANVEFCVIQENLGINGSNVEP